MLTIMYSTKITQMFPLTEQKCNQSCRKSIQTTPEPQIQIQNIFKESFLISQAKHNGIQSCR